MVANKERHMTQAQPDSLAVYGFHVGGALISNWILEGKPPTKRIAVPNGSPARSLELNPIDPTGRKTLILVWTLQTLVRGETSCAGDDIRFVQTVSAAPMSEDVHH